MVGSAAAPRREAAHAVTPIAPDLAVRIAYAFACSLRRRGCNETDFDRLTQTWVEQRFGDTVLLPHIRAGFAAGFCGKPLPLA